MVRELEPSTTQTLHIAVNFETAESKGFRVDPDEIEFAISVAASLAVHADERKWLVGVTANGGVGGAPIAIPASSAPGHLARILETLARAGNVATRSFVDLLLDLRPHRYERPTTIIVTSYFDEKIGQILLDMRRHGHSIVVILAAAKADGVPLADIPIWWAEYNESWARKDALVLVA
jgi:uncharacterized protein (DUF58 family)